jgi:hypothetical protein
MTLNQIFQNAGITHAHIVDDAYDRAPAELIPDGDLQTFLQNLEEEQFDQLAILLDVECQDDALLSALLDLKNLRQVFEKRKRFAPASNVLFATFVRERKDRQAKIKPLIKRLEECGVKCRTYGPDAAGVGRNSPQLIFIDLQLRNRSKLSVNDALTEYQRIVAKHNNAQPFVFLFSTLSSSLETYKEEFRSRAKIFISQFEAVEKKRLSRPEELDHILGSYAGALPRMREMHQAINHVVSAVETARTQLTETLLSLDLVDYFVLYANTVSIEKSKLGTYVSEILMDYLTHEVEQASGFWEFAKVLDSWTLHDIPRSRFGLARPVRKIYSGNMLHAPNRLASETERKISPVEGHFALGDIFFKTSEVRTGPIVSALVITTPACDLARPEDLKDRTIMLCRGKVSVAKQSLPKGDHGVAAVMIDHPTKASEQLLIEWNKKKFVTWDVEEIHAFKIGTSEWTRVGRLRPLFALQLQHTIAADLSRIGVQRTPSLLQPHGFTAFVRDGNIWRSLDAIDANNGSSAALSVSDDKKKKSAFIVTDLAAFRVFTALEEWVSGHPQSQTHDEIKDFCVMPDALQRLLYVEQMPTAKGEFEKACYPLAAVTTLTNPKCIVFVRPDAGSPYDKVSNGKAHENEQVGSILFKFFKKP